MDLSSDRCSPFFMSIRGPSPDCRGVFQCPGGCSVRSISVKGPSLNGCGVHYWPDNYAPDSGGIRAPDIGGIRAQGIDASDIGGVYQGLKEPAWTPDSECTTELVLESLVREGPIWGKGSI